MPSSLFPPGLISSLSFPKFKYRTAQESKAIDYGQCDIIECVYCGGKTDLQHTPLIMQSNFKGSHPPFIEEIQRDMRVSIGKANHIILMGYSLPTDDVIYRNMLAARKNRDSDYGVKCSEVGWAEDAPDVWLKGSELENFLKKNSDSPFAEVIKNAQDIFGKENVRGYAAGIPRVFSGRDLCEVEKKLSKY